MIKPATLYLVATPIGNLGDISKRAIEILNSCDCIYCEDTRVTGKLLSALGISKKLIRLDENLIRKNAQIVINRVLSGETICYCTDAGMPCVSDPGSYLVNIAHEKGADVSIIPGPSACESAYALSGFKATTYVFKGFLPKKKAELQKEIKNILEFDEPTVIYESPARVLSTILEISKLDKDREIFCVKEITKMHENYFKGCALDIYEKLSSSNKKTLKGEFVVVINGLSLEDKKSASNQNLEIAREYALDKKRSGLSSTDIKNDLIKYFNITKNTAFELATFS